VPEPTASDALVSLAEHGELQEFALNFSDDPVAKAMAAAFGACAKLARVLLRMAADAPLVVAARGAHPFARKRAREVCAQRAAAGIGLHCLGRTKDGSPRRPLHVAAGTPLEPYGVAP